jgi:Spy/CpxP family protein refolding chaperone
MKKILIAALLAVGLAGSTAHAQGHMRMGGHPGGPGTGPEPGMLLPMILGKLDLSADQQTKVHAILEAHRPVLQGLFPQLRTAHEQLNAKLFQAGPLKPEDLAPYLDTVTKLKQQVMQEGIKVALDLRGVLTTDQLAKAAEIHDRLQALHAEMKQLLGDPPAMPMTP